MNKQLKCDSWCKNNIKFTRSKSSGLPCRL